MFYLVAERRNIKVVWIRSGLVEPKELKSKEPSRLDYVEEDGNVRKVLANSHSQVANSTVNKLPDVKLPVKKESS